MNKQERLEEVAERFLSKELLDLSDWDKRHILKAMVNMIKWQQQQNKNLYSEEEVIAMLESIISEIEIRKQNIISNSEKMTTDLLEGVCIAFESSQDAIKDLFKQFKK